MLKTSVVIADPGFTGNTAPLIGSCEDTMRRAAQAGFQAVQLTVNRPDEVPRDAILGMMGRENLRVSSIATGGGYAVDGLSLGSGDEQVRTAAVKRMREHIALAELFGGAAVIIGIIRGRISESGSPEAYFSSLRRSIEELLPMAEQKHIPLLLEMINRFDADAFITTEETAGFIRSFQTENLLLQLDTMHLYCEGEDPVEMIGKYAPLIGQFDISGVARRVPDGTGIDFAPIIRALQNIDYRHYLVFEYGSDGMNDTAAAGLHYIRSLM